MKKREKEYARKFKKEELAAVTGSFTYMQRGHSVGESKRNEQEGVIKSLITTAELQNVTNNRI